MGEVICNINDRTFPQTPSGDFVLHAPGEPPTDIAGVSVALYSLKAKLLARVEIAGDADGAVAFQQAFRPGLERHAADRGSPAGSGVRQRQPPLKWFRGAIGKR